jgi:flagellar hook-associated protein 1 FlgK
MATLFNTLNIGYSGLSAAQVGIDTTGHNISNAEVEGYSRQRVVTSAATPLDTAHGNVGNGTNVQEIGRIFDNFVFDKYMKVSADKESSDYQRQKLEELSTYFPDIDGIGLKSDLAAYYDMWQSFADNPENDAIKIALSQQAQALTQNMQQTQKQILGLQKQVNEQLALDINEVNDLAAQLAEVNKAIEIAESGDAFSANDLRDKRSILEKNLSRLIGAEVIRGQIEVNMQVDSNSNTSSGSYTLSVNGFNIVDGNAYHPLTVTNQDNKYGFYSLAYERQDGVLIPIEEAIKGGRIGAALALRGGTINTTSGMPNDGILQQTANDLDALAKGLIEATNNLYAQSGTKKMISNSLKIEGNTALLNSGLNIKAGSFDVVIYDVDGNEVARREITIDAATSLDGAAGSNSIKGQITDSSIDDNSDNNANNDVDDYVDILYSANKQLELYINPEKQSQGYTFAIVDNLTTDEFSSGTNFAGALGLGNFFDGQNARDISVKKSYRDNPTKLHAGYSSAAGDNRLALDMVQQQFESYGFIAGSEVYDTTIYGMYDLTATYVGISANSAISKNDTVTAQFNAIEMEYFSISKVSIDEEMTNLIKYQTSYGAAAKVITTVDQMMQTLLGIKQ